MGAGFVLMALSFKDLMRRLPIVRVLTSHHRDLIEAQQEREEAQRRQADNLRRIKNLERELSVHRWDQQ